MEMTREEELLKILNAMQEENRRMRRKELLKILNAMQDIVYDRYINIEITKSEYINVSLKILELIVDGGLVKD